MTRDEMLAAARLVITTARAEALAFRGRTSDAATAAGVIAALETAGMTRDEFVALSVIIHAANPGLAP